MTFGARQIAVTTTPQVALKAGSFGNAKARLTAGVADVFIGGSDLTSANTATKGLKIAATTVYDLDLSHDDVAYVVCATGTSTLMVVGGGA
jgi:hypothetical protein